MTFVNIEISHGEFLLKFIERESNKINPGANWFHLLDIYIEYRNQRKYGNIVYTNAMPFLPNRTYGQ